MMQLLSASLWSVERRRVKDLKAFSRNHRVPDSGSAAAHRFIQALARPEIEAEIQAAFLRFHDTLGYLRREITRTITREGDASIRTPDFEFQLAIAQDADDPARILWMRDIVGITAAELLNRDEFRQAMPPDLDGIRLHFSRPFAITAVIDAFEARRDLDVRVRFDPDCRWCELRMARFPGFLRIHERELEIHARTLNVKTDVWSAWAMFERMVLGHYGRPKRRSR